MEMMFPALWGESNGTYRFRGIEYVSGVTSPQSGDVILLPTGGFRHRGATRFAHLSNPEGWIGGPFANEDEANNHVTALNDVSAYDAALQLVTAFTAGTTHYQWVNIIEEVPAVHALTDAEVGDGTSDVSGTISGGQLDDFAPELGIAEATIEGFRRVRQGFRSAHRGGHRRACCPFDQRYFGYWD